MPDEVLATKQVAALSNLTEKTVHAMVNAGELPVFDIRGWWRIRRTALEPNGRVAEGRRAHDEQLVRLGMLEKLFSEEVGSP